jgi:2-polyprenyl-3-methyl-5-hydroxy-6-metoxy-1,4-benzoquinol methylase
MQTWQKSNPSFRDLREELFSAAPYEHKKIISCIIDAYDSRIIRAYCKSRFTIININMLDIFFLGLQGKNRLLEVGCGFGLFGCYLATLNPRLVYRGYDLNPRRIEMANLAAARLGLDNVTFHCADARELNVEEQFDSAMFVDLMHHVDDQTKNRLLTMVAERLTPEATLIIKDVTTHPSFKIGFTWALDVLMTQGFDMHYWNESQFHGLLHRHFKSIKTLPIVDWLPYPHIVYICDSPIGSPIA